MIENGNLSNLILWGPPGCGKTTIARALAKSVDMDLLLKTIKEELTKEISKQNLSKKSTKLNVNGQDIKVKEYAMSLNEEQADIFVKDFILNLKDNTNFQKAIGEYKDEIIEMMIDETSQEKSNTQKNEEIQKNKISDHIYKQKIK